MKMTESESDPISDMQLRTAAYKGVQDGRTPHTLRMARPEGSEANRCSPPLDGGQKQQIKLRKTHSMSGISKRYGEKDNREES